MKLRPTVVIVLVVLGVAVALIAADRLAEPVRAADPVAEVRDLQPHAGSFVCPVAVGGQRTRLTTTLARPMTSGDDPSRIDLVSLQDGQRVDPDSLRLLPGSATTISDADADADAAIAAEWRGGPAVAWSEWSLSGEAADVPPGIIAGGCVRPFSDRWVVPGLDTSGGGQAILHFANPFPTDATIAVGFVAPEGPMQPLALRNLSVEGYGTLELDVNEYLPEQPDLTAVVTVAGGRIGVGGYQLVRSAIGGIDGASSLAAADGPSETWTVPWVVDGEDRASWLWIYNPGDRPAPVELSYHTEDGGSLPDGLAEVTVDPGRLRRVDLRGTLPEGASVAAITARSDGAPVVVSGTAQLGGDELDRTGFAVQLGAPATDRSWTISGNSAAGRTERLRVVNPSGVEATVSVDFAGPTLERPPALQEVTVPPGATRTLDLDAHLGATGPWTAFVTSSQGVVVGRVGSSEADERRLVAAVGIPSAAWRTTSAGVLATRDDELVRQYATSLGIARGERLPAVLTDEGTGSPADEDVGVSGEGGLDTPIPDESNGSRTGSDP